MESDNGAPSGEPGRRPCPRAGGLQTGAANRGLLGRLPVPQLLERTGGGGGQKGRGRSARVLQGQTPLARGVAPLAGGHSEHCCLGVPVPRSTCLHRLDLKESPEEGAPSSVLCL